MAGEDDAVSADGGGVSARNKLRAYTTWSEMWSPGGDESPRAAESRRKALQEFLNRMENPAVGA